MRSEPVSIRIPAEFSSAFRAAKRTGESSTACAQRLVIDAVTGASDAEHRAEMERLGEEMARLRRDLRNLARAILFRTSAQQGNDAALADADEWLAKLFGQD